MDHRPINDSLAHLSLRKAAAAAGIDAQILRELLWLINAHDQLIAFPTVANTLINICKLIPEVWGESLADHGLQDWPEILQWILENREDGSLGPLFDLKSKAHNDHPLLGRGMVRHPFYSLLCNISELEEDRDRFCLLQGQFLIAHRLAISNFSDLAQYESYFGPKEWVPAPNSPYPATLTIRELSLAKYASYLRVLPVHQPPEVFVLELGDVVLPEDVNILKRHRDLQYFLQRAWGEREWVERTGGGNTEGGTGTRISGFLAIGSDLAETENLLGDPLDQTLNWGVQTVVTRYSQGKKGQRDLVDLDLEPSEFDEDDELVLSGPGKDDDEDDYFFSLTSQAQIKHIALASQLLPWSPQQLTVSEVADLLRKCSDRWSSSRSKASTSDKERLSMEACALIHVMLWTSSTLEASRDIHYIDRPEMNVDAPLALIAADRSINAHAADSWRIRAISPKYKTSIAGDPEAERQRQDYMHLPEFVGASISIHTLRKLSIQIATSVGTDRSQPEFRIFNRKIATYRKAVDELLHDFDPGGRLTRSKISNYLYDRVACRTQNITNAALMFGRPHALSRVRLFYSTVHVADLQAEYLRHVEELSDEIKAANARGPLRREASPDRLRARHVGSRLCPTFGSVQSAVAKLKDALGQIGKPRGPGDLVRWHNLYSLYSIWSFSFATARRAVITPYVAPDIIDAVTGIGNLTEKDDRRGYRNRLIWLPPKQLRQMRFHADHLKRLAKRLPPINLPKAPVLLLEDDLTPRLAHPKDIQLLMAEFLHFPANVHRRFMRTTLLDRDCPPEVVDAWMGHWNTGQEPWGAMSSFSYGDFVEELRKHLVPVLDELGFVAIRSSLA
ncbi:MAG: hypothetical protein LC114_14625 [Bryobacterales bacterium]|jgi:hypothetical protein|nr:hypothetical protein [Bryobacterales bacterium]